MAALRLRLDAGTRADPVAPAHLLSRKGLIEAACQMRDVANEVDGEGEAALRAKEILDRLYLQECFIDEAPGLTSTKSSRSGAQGLRVHRYVSF